MAMLQRFQSCHLVMTVGSYRRMTNLAEARTAGGGFPKVSPEHRLQFTFDKMSNVAAIAPLAGVRRSIPEWCGVKVPTWFAEDASEVYDGAHLKYLLFKGVVMEEVGPSQGDTTKYLATDYMMRLTYPSPEEAQRRLAIFVALSYDYLSRTQLVTLLPAPISLDRCNPSSLPGMGLTEAYQHLGSLEDMVQDVIPRDSPLWPYVMELLAPEVAEEHHAGPRQSLPVPRTLAMHRAPLPRDAVNTTSRVLGDKLAAPGLEEVVQSRETACCLSPPQFAKQSMMQDRFLGPLRPVDKSASHILVPTAARGVAPDRGRDLSVEGLLREAEEDDVASLGGGVSSLGLPPGGSLYRNMLADRAMAKESNSSSSMRGVTLAPLDENSSTMDAQAPLAAPEGSLAESMALTRRLMANLQRVESAEAAVEIKMNLRAELARRQEGVDAVKAAKGSGIRKFWKTTAPLGIESVPGFKDSTRAMHEANDMYAAGARQLVEAMKEDHRQICRLNERAKKEMLQGVAQLALHQQTTLLKEVDQRRAAQEDKNRRRVVARHSMRQRSQMLKRERKFAQAFQRQHNVLNRQIVDAELRYRDVVDDDQKYSAVLVKREEAVARREEFLAELEVSRAARREETLKWHAKCAVAIAKNKEEKLAIRELVDKRRTENRAGKEMVGPAGGLWGERRPETYRKTLPLTSVSSAVDHDRPGSRSSSRGTSRQGSQRSLAPPVASQLSAREADRQGSSAASGLPASQSSQPVLRTERTEEEWAAELEDELDALLFIEDDDGGITPLHSHASGAVSYGF